MRGDFADVAANVGPLELLAGARAELGYEAQRYEDGARLRMGEIGSELLHTPGHTPEHVSLLLRDHSRGEKPLLLFSGGALLVDDVGRPDLVGGIKAIRAGAQAGRARAALAGRRIGARLPRSGAFGGGHIPGALDVGAGSSFATWAGTVLPPERPILLVLAEAADLWQVSWDLLRIGYDIPAGWLAGGIAIWRTSGRDLDFVPQWTGGGSGGAQECGIRASGA